MGLQLPGELISLLGMLGYTWPEADETKLFEMGQRWMTFAGALEGNASDADAAALRVWQDHTGKGVEAFQRAWAAPDAPAANLHTAVSGAQVTAVGLFVIAGVILALKISVIVQLVVLAIQIAQAIATAVPTLGASLLEIPIFKMITGLIIDQLIGMALDLILGE